MSKKLEAVAWLVMIPGAGCDDCTSGHPRSVWLSEGRADEEAARINRFEGRRSAECRAYVTSTPWMDYAKEAGDD